MLSAHLHMRFPLLKCPSSISLTFSLYLCFKNLFWVLFFHGAFPGLQVRLVALRSPSMVVLKLKHNSCLSLGSTKHGLLGFTLIFLTLKWGLRTSLSPTHFIWGNRPRELHRGRMVQSGNWNTWVLMHPLLLPIMWSWRRALNFMTPIILLFRTGIMKPTLSSYPQDQMRLYAGC